MIDQVAQQKDAYTSGLFWYTDLGEAKAAAQKAGKPMLVLRLLGKLTDECSCANSRFFRTALYANEEVSTYMKDHFILAWTSERPVPVITIDFGDGRKIERSITGNSIHYVLDSNGGIVDAIPGLYGPGRFLKQLQKLEPLHATIKEHPTKADAWVQNFHSTQLTAMQLELMKARLTLTAREAETRAKAKYPAADKAARVAEGKSRVERPMVLAVTEEVQTTDEENWTGLARLMAEDSKLDASSFRLMRAKYPQAAQAGQQAETKRKQESPLLKVLRNFQDSIALDTVKNEYRLHRQIHEWLAQPGPRPKVADLNTRVYAELFLTPREDPWLGLVPENTYTALENEGLAAK